MSGYPSLSVAPRTRPNATTENCSQRVVQCMIIFLRFIAHRQRPRSVASDLSIKSYGVYFRNHRCAKPLPATVGIFFFGPFEIYGMGRGFTLTRRAIIVPTFLPALDQRNGPPPLQRCSDLVLDASCFGGCHERRKPSDGPEQ
jgi:hypothetical protein